MIKTTLSVTLALLSWSGVTAASEGFPYPELEVTPLASQRLKMEAQQENDAAYSNYRAIQAAASATMIAGILSLNDESPVQDDNGRDMSYWAGVVGISSGGAWLGLTTWLSMSYRPQRGGYQQVKRLPKNGAKKRLARERLAEEQLQANATFARRLDRVAAVTNFLAAGFIVGSTENLTTQLVGVGAIALSFAPLAIDGSYIKAYDHHEQYKKRIYGPIAQSTILWDHANQRAMPGIQLGIRF